MTEIVTPDLWEPEGETPSGCPTNYLYVLKPDVHAPVCDLGWWVRLTRCPSDFVSPSCQFSWCVRLSIPGTVEVSSKLAGWPDVILVWRAGGPQHGLRRN